MRRLVKWARPYLSAARHPIIAMAWRIGRTNTALRRELYAERHRVMALNTRLGVVLRERDQARRDAELLALCAKDRAGALAFLRDAHRIDKGEVPGEVA